MAVSGFVAYQLALIGADGEPEFDALGQPIATGPIIELPTPRWGRKIKKERHDIPLETEKGRRWIYPQFDRLIFGLTFRGFPDNIALLQALDDAVDGQRDPFFLYIDWLTIQVSGFGFNVSLPTSIFVRKQPDWEETNEQPGVQNGEGLSRIVDVEIIFSEEPTGSDIT